MIAHLIILALAAAAAHDVSGRRALLAFNNTNASLTDAAVVKAVGTAQNATISARDLLIVNNVYGAQGTSAAHKPFQIGDVIQEYVIGHVAAHGSEDAVEDNQISAGVAAAQAVVAVGYTTAAVLNSTTVPLVDALAAIEKAENLTSQVIQEGSTVDPARKASATLVAKAAHDSSLVLYWFNLTGGKPNDGKTFNQSIISSVGLGEAGANGTIDKTIQTQIAAGANPALGMAYMDVFIHELHGAIATYKGDLQSAISAQSEASEAAGMAVTAFLGNRTAQLPSDLPSKFSQLVSQAQTVAKNAATGASSTNGDISNLYTSLNTLDGQVESAMRSIA